MATESVVQRAFAGGELAPALYARADQAKYLTGLRTCRNFLVLRSGGVSNRAGFRYVSPCKTNASTVRLLRYNSEVAGESILIEAGDGYLRFFKAGAAVQVSGVTAWSGATAYVIGDIAESGGVNYYCVKAHTNHAPPNATYWYAMPGSLLELPHPFGTAAFSWVQSGRVITLTQESAQPHELIFVELTRWVIQAITTAPTTPAPENLVLTPGGTGTRYAAYVVTAALAETYEESLVSNVVVNTGVAEPTPDAPHVLDWDAVTGAAEYYLYADPYGNGTFGFIGTATGVNQFKDSGFVPDFTVTPPLARTLFATSGNYPKRAAHYQQRRFFAHTANEPDAMWGSRVGFPSNFAISSPLQDDDAITFKIAGNQHHPVRNLVGLKSLVVLTDGGEWVVRGGADGVLSPSALSADQEAYYGADDVRPVVIGNAIVYVQARGSIVRDLQFTQTVEGFAGRDLTIYASHLFDPYTVAELDYAQVPHSIVWVVRSDGVLLGLTYLREHDIWGWHRHDTSGVFEHVCVVPENEEDAVYVIVRRTIDGGTVRYIERLESREILDFNTEAFFVDSGLSYAGAPTSNVTGLDHLEGEVVAVLGDGQVVYSGDPNGVNAESFRVSGGAINLPAAYSAIHVGLRIVAEIETLDLDVEGSSVRDKRKRVAGLSVLLESSSRAFRAGPDVDHLRRFEPAAHESTAPAVTGQVEMSLTSGFDKYGRVLIRQTDPLPLTILGVLPQVELGG